MHTGETRGPKKTQEVYGWAVKKALCVLLNWIISRTCSSNRVCPSAGGPHAGSQHFSYLRSSSFQRPAAKRGNMEPRGNDLLKEFFPARKRIKSLPPVINQITKKRPWDKFKGKRRQALQHFCILLVTPRRDFTATCSVLKAVFSFTFYFS